MIRHAIPQDRERFLELWKEFLSDPSPAVYHLPTPKTLRFFGSIFDAFVSGSRPGVVLLVDEGAALLWGDVGLNDNVDSRYGYVAQAWGTYIAPKLRHDGLAPRMWREGLARLGDLGFDGMIGGVGLDKVGTYDFWNEQGTWARSAEVFVPIRKRPFP